MLLSSIMPIKIKVSRIYLAPRIKEASIVRKILGKLPYPLPWLFITGYWGYTFEPLVVCFHTPITLIISPSVHKIRNSMLCHFLSANIERIVDIFFCTDMISIFNIGSPTVYATNTTNCTINTQHRSSRRR